MKHKSAASRNEMMLTAPVQKVIPKLAVPSIISMLITSIYNMADTFFVSQLGTSASGAVGVIFSAMAIIQAFSFMLGMGTGTNVSQNLGGQIINNSLEAVDSSVQGDLTTHAAAADQTTTLDFHLGSILSCLNFFAFLIKVPPARSTRRGHSSRT